MSIFYIGSYTEIISGDFGGQGEGIYVVELNDETGELKHLHATPTVNPAYLTISHDKRFLYTITEVLEEKQPKVKAYKINNDFSLTFLNELPINGSLPCHIEFKNNAVLITCYGTGDLFRFTTNNNGELLQQTHYFKHSGTSINKERQEAPHAHQTVIHSNEQDVFVPDLGIDKIKSYRLHENDLIIQTNRDIDIPKGSGPRHLVFNDKEDTGYLINELTGDISILKKENDKYVLKKSVKSLPDSFKKTPSASAIRIHPKKSFLYAANRTLDAITIFKIIDNDLQLLDFQYTQGKTLREFNISPDGKWLIACLQDSNDTIVYKINLNGKLTETYRTKNFTSPVCIAFL